LKNPADSSLNGLNHDILNRKSVSPFMFCILYKRLKVLSFLVALDDFNDEKIKNCLENGSQDIRRPILLGLKKRLEKVDRQSTVVLGRKYHCDSPLFLISSKSMIYSTKEIAGVEVMLLQNGQSR